MVASQHTLIRARCKDRAVEKSGKYTGRHSRFLGRQESAA